MALYVIVTGVGQWIHTLGLDGVTPVRLWLPQCTIPMVAPSAQVPIAADTSVTSDVQTTSQVLVSAPAAVSDSTQLQDSAATESIDVSKELPVNEAPGAGKSYLYFCRNCEQLFSEQLALKEHTCSGVVQSEAVSSTGANLVSKLQCKFCLKVFSRTWTLNVHMRTHTGERPYRCLVCDKAFSDKSNMRQHTLIHTEKSKQFKCPSCHQTFAQKRYMKKHFIETCRRKGAENELGSDDITADSRTVEHHKQQKNYVIYLPTAKITPVSIPPPPPTVIKNEPVEVVGVEAEEVGVEAEEVGAGEEDSGRWDTSIFLAGDQVAVQPPAEQEEPRHQSEQQQQQPQQQLACDACKRRFNNERQFKSHKCQYL